MVDAHEATRTAKRLAIEAGFALCGVAPAEATEHRQHVLDWLAAGKHGQMRYLADHIDTRLDPRRLLPGARAILCVADRLPSGTDDADGGGEPRGRVARYARITDYHRVMKRRLHGVADQLAERWPDHAYRTCVDTAPLLEREHAARSGVGWVGKHTLVLHPRFGSHLMLGEIVTTLPLTPDEPMRDHCGTCTRCIDACPTGCITPWSVDASRCISYTTIEHRGAIDPSLHAPADDWLFGCDVCQQVCPFNSIAPPAPIPPGYEAAAESFNLLDVLDWTAEERSAALTRSAMKRAKLDMLKRNALIAAGNLLAKPGDEPWRAALRRRIEQAADDEDESPLVRATARQVMGRLT